MTKQKRIEQLEEELEEAVKEIGTQAGELLKAQEQIKVLADRVSPLNDKVAELMSDNRQQRVLVAKAEGETFKLMGMLQSTTNALENLSEKGVG